MGNINYSSFKTTSSTKFMGTMLIFFHNQLTTKAHVYHPLCKSYIMHFNVYLLSISMHMYEVIN